MTKKEYDKIYYQKNKAKSLADAKKYREKNPQYYRDKNKVRYALKKDEINAHKMKWLAEDEDGLFRVYMLKDNYVGVTMNTKRRMLEHRSKRKYTGKFMCILHTTDCAKDASELEDLLHDMGYEGKNRMNIKYA